MLISDIPALTARRTPHAPALRFGERRWSYAEFHQRVTRVAEALGALAEPGERVAILARNCPEYLECCYGVPAAALVLTLVNFRLSPAEIRYVLADSGASVVVTEPEYLPVIQRLRAELPAIREVVLIGEQDDQRPDVRGYQELLAARGAGAGAARRPDQDDAAWLLYTSGTTGFPKGATLTHRAVTTAVLSSAAAFEHRADEVCLFHAPLCHVSTYYILLWHLRGFDVTLLRAFDPDAWCRAVQEHRVTYTLAVPTVLVMLLDHPGIDDYDLSSLTGILYGGAPTPVEVLRRAVRRWPGVGLHTAFGMTELGGNATYLGPAEHRHALEHHPERLRSIGRALPLCATRVVDEDLRDVPVGVPGELLVAGEQLTAGYWANPAATEGAFAGEWFRTADLARIDEHGLLYIVGRKKDMIISGGENIYPAEVEDVLYQHADVLEASVVGASDPTWGERVVAVVRRRPRSSVDGAELIEFCRQRLASYKKPRQVVFVDSLPKNATGKILKSVLRERLEAGEASPP
jgi:acyl-CoA synthetase (AMP-forming)/AMP-acid ligase II